jgi:hypothetical protein
MELIRKPTIPEKRLIALLVEKSSISQPSELEKDLLVQPMDDGGMGSLILYPNGIIIKNRIMGEQVSDYKFKDQDGVDVIASLNLDQNGSLFELDIWKTDFSKLLKFPEV